MKRGFALLVIGLVAFCGTASAAEVRALKAVDGAQVWFSEDHTVPMIAMTASFPSGSVYDPPGRSGMAALASALLDQGAGGLGAAAFQDALAAGGIWLEAETGRDVASVTLITLSSQAKRAFRLLGQALSHPRFDADAVERVRAQMLQSIARQGEDPAAVAERAFYSLYFGPYTYGRPVDGDPHGLAAVTPQELRLFAATHWVRGGLRIAIAGDVDAATATALLHSAFAGLPAAAPALPPGPARVGAPGLHVLSTTVPQPVVLFGLPGLKCSDPDFLPAMIANYILGGGDSSRLAVELRGKDGLAYGVSTDLVAYRQSGLVLGVMGAERDNVRDAIADVGKVMRRFAEDGPTDDELADAKLYLKGSFPLAFASDADAAAELNRLERQGLPLDYLERRAALIDAVGIDDVRRVARRLFDPSKLTIVVAGTLPAEEPDSDDSQ